MSGYQGNPKAGCCEQHDWPRCVAEIRQEFSMAGERHSRIVNDPFVYWTGYQRGGMSLPDQTNGLAECLENIGSIFYSQPARVYESGELRWEAGQVTGRYGFTRLPLGDSGIETKGACSLTQEIGVGHREQSKFRVLPVEFEQDFRPYARRFSRRDGEYRYIYSHFRRLSVLSWTYKESRFPAPKRRKAASLDGIEYKEDTGVSSLVSRVR